MFLYANVCASACVRKRDGERERESEREKECARERESISVRIFLWRLECERFQHNLFVARKHNHLPFAIFCFFCPPFITKLSEVACGRALMSDARPQRAFCVIHADACSVPYNPKKAGVVDKAGTASMMASTASVALCDILQSCRSEQLLFCVLQETHVDRKSSQKDS